MRKLKCILAGVLAMTLVFGMIGCGNKSEDTLTEGDLSNETSDDVKKTEDNTTQEEASEDVNDSNEGEEEADAYTVLTDENGNVYDLGGMEIIIRDWWSEDETTEATNAYEEAREEYYDWIQETYNFTIRSLGMSSWGTAPEDFVNYATSGGEENFIFTLYQGSALVSAIHSGLMYDLATLDCLDFSEEKWQNKVYQLMTIGDSIYGMRGIACEPTAGIYFNKRLLQECGIDPEDIYKYQENGEWTWDKFEELCKQCMLDTDNDGTIDLYAMTNFTSTLYPAAVYSNGGEFIGRDSNGYYNDLESDETMEALNWVLDMLGKYEMIYPEDAAWDYTFTAFVNGEAVFSCANAYQAGQWSDMEDDFGFVCFPKGPKATDYATCYYDNVFVIPACYDADKAWKIAFAYNLYTDPVPGYEDYAAWKSNYYNSFRDTESVDYTMARMMTNGIITYHTMISGLDLGPDLIWGISADSTPAQQAEEIRNTWQSYIDTSNGK